MAKKRMIVNFNSEIKKILISKSIPVHDGFSFLLCLYYGTQPSYTPKELERRVFATGIISKDYTNNTIKWKLPLFEDTETGFEWVKEWMDLFKEVNPERRGVKADVLKRMKKFFVNNPSIRKDDVFEGTKLYLRGVSEAKYCKKSHKFIYETDGVSMLLDFVEQHLKRKETSNIYNSDII